MSWPSDLGRLREYFGRVTLAESENALVSVYALVAAVRNFAYQSASSGPWCVRCLGTRLGKDRLGWTLRGANLGLSRRHQLGRGGLVVSLAGRKPFVGLEPTKR